MTNCSDVGLFFDGELSEAQADEFRDHLAECPRCQNKLLGLMQEAAATNVDLTDKRTKR